MNIEEYNLKAISNGNTYGKESEKDLIESIKKAKEYPIPIEEEEWCPVEEDEPQLGKGFKSTSIDIDILLHDGTVIMNGYYSHSRDKYYDNNGNVIKMKLVKGWRTHEHL